jgi:hypothetical protein
VPNGAEDRGVNRASAFLVSGCAMTKAHERWKNRIVGYGEEAPDQLLANPPVCYNSLHENGANVHLVQPDEAGRRIQFPTVLQDLRAVASVQRMRSAHRATRINQVPWAFVSGMSQPQGFRALFCKSGSSSRTQSSMARGECWSRFAVSNPAESFSGGAQARTQGCGLRGLWRVCVSVLRGIRAEVFVHRSRKQRRIRPSKIRQIQRHNRLALCSWLPRGVPSALLQLQRWQALERWAVPA